MRRRVLRVPRSFLVKVQALGLGPTEIRNFLRACSRPLRPAFRVNALKAAPALMKRLDMVGCKMSPIPWCADGYFAGTLGVRSTSLGLSRPHIVGEIYMQESTSMIPVEALRASLRLKHARWNTHGILRILDLCAAPGSKTTQLGACFREGIIVANDSDQGRAWRLRTNLLRCGVTNTLVTTLDGRLIGGLTSEVFDAVLVDAPCSGEGTIRKNPYVLERWRRSEHEAVIHAMAETQWELLDSAWAALRPGGCLVYSTCTLNTLENEGPCRRLLREYASASIVDVSELLSLQDSKTKDGFLRIWPHTYDTEGFFVACFYKCLADEVSAQEDGLPCFLTLDEQGSPLVPLCATEKEQVRGKLRRELGLCPDDTKHMYAKGTNSAVWLQRAMCRDIESLFAYAIAPGLLIGRHTEQGLQLSDELVFFVGERASKNAAEFSSEDWVALEARICQSVSSSNAHMAFVASRGDVEGVRQILENMCSSRLKPNEVTYTTLLATYTHKNDAHGAERVLSEMSRNRLRIGIITYNAVLNVYSKALDQNRIHRLLRMMKEQMLQPDLTSMNMLMYSQRRDPLAMQESLAAMLKARIEPDTITYTTLLHAHAERGDAFNAESVWNTMQKLGLKLDATSYTALIKAFSTKRDLQKAEHVFDTMCQKSVRRAVVSYNALLNAYCRAHKSEACERLFEDMQENVVVPDVVSFTTLMKANADTGDITRTKQLFLFLQQARLTPNSVTYGVLMSACARQGDVSSTTQLLSEMSAANLQPNIKHYTSAVHAHAIRGDTSGARAAFLASRESSLQPNRACYNALLQAYARARDQLGHTTIMEELRHWQTQANISKSSH